MFGPQRLDRVDEGRQVRRHGASNEARLNPLDGGIAGLDNNQTATSNSLTSTKKKVYLREIPIDPMTGEQSWDLRSVYDSKDSGSWGGENVFDVHSKSDGQSLNGEKYRDW